MEVERPSDSHDPTVHQGKDGYLFLSGGNHSVFSLFSGKTMPARGSVERFVDNLTARQKYCAAKGIRFHTIVFPEKCVVLRDRVGTDLPLRSVYESVYRPQLADLDVHYPIAALERTPDALSRTDSHYTAHGNLGVAREILNGIFPADLIAQGCEVLAGRIRVRKGYLGDIGRKVPGLPPEDIAILASGPGAVHVTNGVAGGNDGICDLTETPDALSGRTLLIFGDSFMRGAQGFLAQFYHRVIFCRTRFFHYELVDAFRPDAIFCGIAERYLSRVDVDANRPHFLSYPLMHGRAIAPSEGFGEVWTRFADARAMAGAVGVTPGGG